MLSRQARSIFTLLLAAMIAIPALLAQHTFRGGINGSVVDQSGSAIAGATIEVTNVETNVTLKTVSSSAGEYSFPELNLGKYTVIASANGFKTEKITGLNVSAGVIFTQPIQLSVAASAETVEVAADAYALDTTSTTQTAIIDSEAVTDSPQNGRDFTHLVALVPGFSNTGIAGFGSLNGTRMNQINWQIDGVDNNDVWHNIPAVNQPGVSGIAGVILPLDAVEQFSVQTNASADTGRNPGGTATLGLKSGTNTLHGSAYYFNRNELFGVKNPFVESKQKVRNYNDGFSVGGPVRKDKLFYFINYEQQRFVIGSSKQVTEPTTVWQKYATDVITSNGGSVSSISTGLIKLLWPSHTLTSSRETSAPVLNNYVSTDPEFGFSHNGVAKFDYTINERNSISGHWFVGQGNQVAPVGSQLLPYYEAAPIHVQNYQLSYNHTFTPSLTNQIVSGVNYFNQLFSDNQTGYDVTTVGLTDGEAYKNAPKLQIQGFDATGETPPEGRQDITGHISDNLSWVKGKHQARFGFEFRRIQLDEFYHRNAQGSFTFNGAQGGWDLTKSALSSNVDPKSDFGQALLALSDFLAGDVQKSTIAVGNPERLVYVHTFGAFAQDSYQITPKLNINYGLRWDYEGPFFDNKKDLSVFRPTATGADDGLAFQGNQISSIYDPAYTDFSPRVGLSYQARAHTVARIGSGLYYDTPNLNPFLDNRPGNGAPNGVEGNPGGPNPVATSTASGYTWKTGVNPFTSSATTAGVFSIQKSFKPSYTINYTAQIEQSLGNNVIAQLGYVGSFGHHLLSILDINQASPNATALVPSTRPYYYGNYKAYGAINEIRSIGNSNYHSLQATLRASNYHHLSTQLAYTWSHALDDVTSYRGALPQDSRNFKGDYGSSDYDNRQTLVGQLTYAVPELASHKQIAGGWQIVSALAFHTGFPFSVFSDGQTDNTGEGNQRANQVANPYTGFKKREVGADWLNPAAFVDPAAGTWGTTRRNAYVGPGYSDVDLSIFKNTKIGERVTAQFRVEFYNLFNYVNYALPTGSDGSFFTPNYTPRSELQLNDTIGDANGAPGIGAGEPFNTQLALKLTF